MNDKLPLIQEVEDIDIAHPLPSDKKNKYPIIVKFLQRSIRNEIYANKSNFGGTEIAVTQSLTKRIQNFKLYTKVFWI